MNNYMAFFPIQLGLKNFNLSPLVTMLQTPPMENAKLKATPSQPRIQLKYQLKVYLVGFLMRTHMKQGYANVTGSVIPPIKPAMLERKGSATPMKNDTNPKNTLKPDLTHIEQGRLVLLVYPASKLSNAGMEYIWKLLKQLNTTSRKFKARRPLGMSWLWNAYRAVRIPPEGICKNKPYRLISIRFTD